MKIDYHETSKTYDDSITRYFPKVLEQSFITALGKEKSDLFVRILRETKRWENDGGVYLKPSSFNENLLDHITFLLKWLNEIEAEYPGLFKEIFEGEKIMGPNELRIALTIHDIGEIVVGDLCAVSPLYENGDAKKHKLKEARAAKMMIYRNLGWELAKKIVKLYNFYEEKRKDHLPSMLGQVLDKGHGMDTFCRIFLPFNLDNPNFDIKTRGLFANEILLKPANSLVKNLSKNSALELRELIYKKVLNANIGFPDPKYQEGLNGVREKYRFFFK